MFVYKISYKFSWLLFSQYPYLKLDDIRENSEAAAETYVSDCQDHF